MNTTPTTIATVTQLISFDIGIKHLAYCIFEYSSITPTKYDILEWKVINLLETETETENVPQIQSICQTPLKTTSKKTSPKICSKIAQFSSPPNITPTEYYCNKHANLQTKYLLPQDIKLPRYSTTQMNKMDKSALQEYANKLSPNTIINQTTKKSLISYIQILQPNIYLQPIISPSKSTTKANRANMVDLCHTLFKQLLQIDSRFPQIQQVVIENQIGNIAARMMVIQGMITMFYTSRNRNIQIDHVSSSHKLKYAASLVSLPTTSTNTPETPMKSKTIYQEHKSHAKDYCEIILQSDPKFSIFYEEFRGNKKKKDDLADCFLQGIWFMKTENS
jgi:hypothetical protein